MDMLKASGLAVCAALCALILRRLRPELGAAISLAAGVMMLALCVPQLLSVAEGIASLARSGGIRDAYLTSLMKVAGVSLLSDFAAQTCRDAGEEGLAVKTELCARIMLLSLALPYMQSLLSAVLSLSP
ncbi:MAG: stage III sporulation AC/AD family protein [Clostridia bacterium]|nr:stage III sporulation AC/AD family protein [Clostridia bacterium]